MATTAARCATPKAPRAASYTTRWGTTRAASASLVARRYDVNANQLFNWMRDPRFASVEDSDEIAEPVFLPVEIIGAGEPAPSQPAETKAAGAVEIELPNGCRLTLRGGFDADAVARLARGLVG